MIFCEVTEYHDLIGELLRHAGYEFYAARAAKREPLHRPSRDTLAVPVSFTEDFLSRRSAPTAVPVLVRP